MTVLAAAVMAQPAGRGIVSGTVVEAASGDPVRKAVVTLTWQGSPKSWATTRTDGSGKFRFEGLPAGKFELRAVKTGVGTAVYGGNGARELGEFVALGDGEAREGLTLRFIHSGSISGRVLDADGDPVLGAQVGLMRPGRNMGERTLLNFRYASTNDRGEYKFSSIDPGQYYPVANLFPRVSPGSPQYPIRHYYAGARTSKDANPINVQPGESLSGIDFQVGAVALVKVRGQISGFPQQPPEPTGDGPHTRRNGIGVMIAQVEQGAMGWFGAGAAPPEYQFSFGDVPEGRYRIEADERIDDKEYSASQDVDVRQGMSDILLSLVPAVDLKGHLRVEGNGGPPPASFNIVLLRDIAGRRTVSAHPGPDGSFTMPGMTQGQWGLGLNPRGGFVKSATLGDKDVRFTWLEIGPKTDAPFNIVISMNTAKVEGQVEAAGADSTRAGILLAPFGALHTLTRFYRSAAADGEGKFKLEGLAPGKYKIFALEKMAATGFLSPEAADQLDALGTEIELTEGATTQVRPKLIPMERAKEALP
jgi:hypothetical protein